MLNRLRKLLGSRTRSEKTTPSREALRAILNDDFGKLEKLRGKGLDITATTETDRWNYLHRSLLGFRRQPSAEMLKLLIDLGNDVDAIDIYGNAPLHYAARLKNAELVAVLLEAGAEVNPVNRDGINPLRQCLVKKPFNHDVIRVLLAAGADMQQESEGGISVRELVDMIAHGDPGLIDLFDEYV